jgi:hypothetical protein
MYNYQTMGKQLQHLTFEDWVLYVFDHPVPVGQELEWHWDSERDWWDESGEPAVTVQWLTRLFENAAQVLLPYTDAQLNQGLWFLASNACSNHMFALLDTSVPWAARQRCIASIHTLYEGCFARRCSAALSHLPEPVENPLNMVCYMWWDILPISGQPGDPARRDLDRSILQVMEATLQLDSLACQESALHGLGHWHMHYPRQVGEIIDKFSITHADIPEKLRQYMQAAYSGCVL